MFIFFLVQALIDFRINEIVLEYIVEIKNTELYFGARECDVFLMFLYLILVMEILIAYVCFFIGSLLGPYRNRKMYSYVQYILFCVIYSSRNKYIEYTPIAELLLLTFYKGFSLINLNNGKSFYKTVKNIDNYINFKFKKHLYLTCFHISLLFTNIFILETIAIILWTLKYIHVLIINILSAWCPMCLFLMKTRLFNNKPRPQSVISPSSLIFIPPPSQIQNTASLQQQCYITPSTVLAPTVSTTTASCYECTKININNLQQQRPMLKSFALPTTRTKNTMTTSSLSSLSLIPPSSSSALSLFSSSSSTDENQRKIIPRKSCLVAEKRNIQFLNKSLQTNRCDNFVKADIHDNNKGVKQKVNPSFKNPNVTSGPSHTKLEPTKKQNHQMSKNRISTNINNNPNCASTSNNAMSHNYSGPVVTPRLCHIEKKTLKYNRLLICVLSIIFMILLTYESLFEIKMYVKFFDKILLDKTIYCHTFIMLHLICTIEISFIYILQNYTIIKKYNCAVLFIICVWCAVHLLIIKIEMPTENWLHLFVVAQIIISPILIIGQIHHNPFIYQCVATHEPINIIRDIGHTIGVIISILLKLYLLEYFNVYDVLFYYDYVLIVILCITIIYHICLL